MAQSRSNSGKAVLSWIGWAALWLALIVDTTKGARKNPSNVLQCKDEDDRPVDWFVMYKIPRIRESANPAIEAGAAYLYINSNTVSRGWILSRRDVTMKNSIPGYTLAPLYDDATTTWLMYNDQPPNARALPNYGHAKGVLAIKAKKGFWLIHSVPGYPAEPHSGEPPKRSSKIDDKKISTSEKTPLPDGEYGYPDSGKHNGQSFMCISINADQTETIAEQLLYNQIIVYRRNLLNGTASQYPLFTQVSGNKRKKNKAPFTKRADVKSSGGTIFSSFAKSDKWDRDLYDDFVAPELQSDLLVETWLNGRGKLPSDCNSSRVLNVESVNLTAASVVFASSRDHSKWAVSTESGNWLCVGDINRADTQFNRGGGTVCLKSADLWRSYRNAVDDVEPCPIVKEGVFGRFKNWIRSKFG